jgi:peptidoglycan hydrolase CwlO-like protein
MLRYAELRRLGDSQESVSERKAILAKHAHELEATISELQQTVAVLHGKLAMYAEKERQFSSIQAEENSDEHTQTKPLDHHAPTRR